IRVCTTKARSTRPPTTSRSRSRRIVSTSGSSAKPVSGPLVSSYSIERCLTPTREAGIVWLMVRARARDVEDAMAFTDLRAFIDRVEDLGELKRVSGAHWDLEIGGITELAQHQINGPAVLFDDIPDYPSGYRVFVNSMGSASRTALVLGLPTGLSMRELLPLWRERSRDVSPIPMNYD